MAHTYNVTFQRLLHHCTEVTVVVAARSFTTRPVTYVG
ncbi:hypothetical protein SORBI_3010G071650 [Sorghum bicolor]|nr:hypothetical protein SORBI_3010G071650 [Sorghum bicolor]